MFNIFWDVLGKISIICSIVGLPIALVQIWQIKSRTKATEVAMKKYLLLEKSTILNKIYEEIIKQEDLIAKIQGMLDVPGISHQKIKEDCQIVVSSLNMCIYNMPIEHEELSEMMKTAVIHMQKHINLQNGEELFEVADILYVVISKLKKIREGYLNDSIVNISKNQNM